MKFRFNQGKQDGVKTFPRPELWKQEDCSGSLWGKDNMRIYLQRRCGNRSTWMRISQSAPRWHSPHPGHALSGRCFSCLLMLLHSGRGSRRIRTCPHSEMQPCHLHFPGHPLSPEGRKSQSLWRWLCLCPGPGLQRHRSCSCVHTGLRGLLG